MVLLRNGQHHVALRLLIQDTGFGTVGFDPQSVRGKGCGLDISGPDDVPVFQDLHLPADQVLPICVTFHGLPFRIAIH